MSSRDRSIEFGRACWGDNWRSCSPAAGSAIAHRRRGCRIGRRTAGAALPGVLIIVSALLVASAGWFETSITDVRSVNAYASRSVAFHAAEAALDACERGFAGYVASAVSSVGTPPPADGRVASVERAAMPRESELALSFARLGGGTADFQRAVDPPVPLDTVPGTFTSFAEPSAWRRPGMFDGPSAWHPFAAWPGSAVPPACLIEHWPIASRPHWRAYLLTARGTGATRATAVWLQLQLAFDGGYRVARRWRHVVAAPSTSGVSG